MCRSACETQPVKLQPLSMFLTWLLLWHYTLVPNVGAAPSDANKPHPYSKQSPHITHSSQSQYNSPLAVRCSYECQCESSSEPLCADGTPPAADVCGCCVSCGLGDGSRCGRGARCKRDLTCRFPYRGAPDGICRVPNGLSCKIQDQVYHHGEFFMLDCRTQCACQNGTYACSSLCPQENISPRSNKCTHPRLVEVPGQCCREWMCDAPKVEKPPECPVTTNHWSPCSATCGGGVSHQVSPDAKCPPGNGTRMCQEHSCLEPKLTEQTHHHHIRQKSRKCRATRRLGPSRLRVGRCYSSRLFSPRVCGRCGARDQQCCTPALSTTIQIDMFCDYVDDYYDDVSTLVYDQMRIEEDIWFTEKFKSAKNHKKRQQKGWYNPRAEKQFPNKQLMNVNVEWIIKCDCGQEYCAKLDKSQRNGPILPVGMERAGAGAMLPTRSYEYSSLRRVHRTSTPLKKH